MFRKIALFISLFFLFLGLDNCKSPVEPERVIEYRYNVEVTYTRAKVAYPEREAYVRLNYHLLDPGLPGWESHDNGTLEMRRIAENTYRCYLPKVFIHTPRESSKYLKHEVEIGDPRSSERDVTAEGIEVQGAYDLEIYVGEALVSGNIISRLLFRMSKEDK